MWERCVQCVVIRPRVVPVLSQQLRCQEVYAFDRAGHVLDSLWSVPPCEFSQLFFRSARAARPRGLGRRGPRTASGCDASLVQGMKGMCSGRAFVNVCEWVCVCAEDPCEACVGPIEYLVRVGL